MGDRICMTFVRMNEWGTERSPVLYAHWDGMRLLDKAAEFWELYHEEIRDEPSNFMVNFLNWLRNGRVEDGGYYLYRDEEHSCSPDDCGFWDFNTANGMFTQAQ